VYSATKNTDLTEGIHEDVSSDLAREHGGRVGDHAGILGNQGGMLDNLGGTPARALGSDAKTLPGSSLIAGSSNTTNSTDFTDGVYESAQKGMQSAKSVSNDLSSEAQKTASSLSAQAQDLSSKISAEASNASSTLSSEAQNVSSNLSSGANNMTSGASNTSGGLLERVKETVSGVFGGSSSPSTANAMAAGASAGTKDTDFTEGIHEDAGRGIESVRGATARR